MGSAPQSGSAARVSRAPSRRRLGDGLRITPAERTQLHARSSEATKARAEQYEWLRRKATEVAVLLDAIKDPVERFMQATMCGAQVSVNDVLSRFVASPPPPSMIAAWFAKHVKTSPTHRQVDAKGPFGWRKVERASGYFREGAEGWLEYGYGERRSSSVSVFADGTLEYDHPHAYGNAFHYETLREMAMLCGLADLRKEHAEDAGETVERDVGRPKTRLDEIIQARRSGGQDFGRRNFKAGE